ncbi:MAG: DMT family transporter [Thermoleophilia bacterium]
MHTRPPASAYFALTGTTLAFGLSFVGTKFGLQGFEPLLLAFLRFAFAGGILWVAWRASGARERATRAELARLALLGFVSLTVYFTLENSGIARTSASEAAVLMAGVPIVVLVLNRFTLHEHTSARELAGIALSFAGILALVGVSGNEGESSTVGNLLVLGACLAAGGYALLARHLLVDRSPLYVTAFQNLFGALFMLPLTLIEAAVVGVRTPTWTAVGALVYLTTICSVVGYLLLNYAFGYVSAGRASVFLNLIPIVGIAGAYVLLGERFGLWQVVAAAVVISGVWLANSGQKRASGQPAAA